MSGPPDPMMAFPKVDDEEAMKFIQQEMYCVNVKVMAFWDVTPYTLRHGN
jgi:hypothetical protein